MPIKVKCRLCGKYFWQVNNSHLKKHGYTVTDYKEEYDLTYVTALVVRQAVSQSMMGNKYWVGKRHKPETIAKMKRRVIVHTAQSRAKISESLIGNKRALGRKHSKAVRKYIARFNRNWWKNRKRLYGQLTSGGKPKRQFRGDTAY